MKKGDFPSKAVRVNITIEFITIETEVRPSTKFQLEFDNFLLFFGPSLPKKGISSL